MPTDSAVEAVRSSLGLQLFAILAAIFAPIWWAMTFSLLIYKITFLRYPPTAFGFEIVSTALVWITQAGAVTFIKRGNLTENPPFLALGVGFAVVTAGGAAYYMYGQTYVMMLDLGFSATMVAINGILILGGVFTMQSFGGENAQVLAQQHQQQAQQGSAKHQKSE
uniref:Uncharacterized protein n=1 Tax=Neobodo designis TaxID=312471 RepID=A0A7S1W7D2_NEODS